MNLADVRVGHISRTSGPAQTGPDTGTVTADCVQSNRKQAPGRRSRARTGRRGVRPAPAAPDPATSTATSAAGAADADEQAERAATIARIVAAMGELTPEDRHRLALLLPAPRCRAA